MASPTAPRAMHRTVLDAAKDGALHGGFSTSDLEATNAVIHLCDSACAYSPSDFALFAASRVRVVAGLSDTAHPGEPRRVHRCGAGAHRQGRQRERRDGGVQSTLPLSMRRLTRPIALTHSYIPCAARLDGTHQGRLVAVFATFLHLLLLLVGVRTDRRGGGASASGE